MYTPSQDELDFLFALHQQTNGDLQAEVSMYDVGTTLGLEKSRSSDLCQDMMIEELVELKSLSGSITLQTKGLECLQKAGLIQGAIAQARLGSGPILDDTDRQNTCQLIDEVKSAIGSSPQNYPQIEALVIDIKTLEVQLLSSQPKTAIIKATLAAISQSMGKIDTGVSSKVAGFIDI